MRLRNAQRSLGEVPSETLAGVRAERDELKRQRDAGNEANMEKAVRLDDLTATIERLTKERDEALASVVKHASEAKYWILTHVEACQQLSRENNALTSTNARMRTALEPFADLNSWTEMIAEDAEMSPTIPPTNRRITMADHRAAKAALSDVPDLVAEIFMKILSPKQIIADAPQLAAENEALRKELQNGAGVISEYVEKACDKAGIPSGNEHEDYSLTTRLDYLVIGKEFFARRYEETLIERDTLRKENAELKHHNTELRANCQDDMDTHDLLRAERDRLQEQVRTLEAQIAKAHDDKHGASSMCCSLREQEKQRADALQEQVRVLREAIPVALKWFTNAGLDHEDLFCEDGTHVAEKLRNALAATEPKEENRRFLAEFEEKVVKLEARAQKLEVALREIIEDALSNGNAIGKVKITILKQAEALLAN